MDKNELFREVTLRLCGNLDIGEGLRSCLEYLSTQMPGDRMYLQKYDHDRGVMWCIVRANRDRGERVDTQVPLTPEARKSLAGLQDAWEAGTHPEVLAINNSLEDPTAHCLLEAFGEPPSSALCLPLDVGSQGVGTLVLLAEGNDQFEERHIELCKSIREPFLVAMSNTLEYHEVLALKEQLADNNRYMSSELRKQSGDEIVGIKFGLNEVMDKVAHVAGLESPVLLLGETGTGKDVIANAIHNSSSRQEKPFIKVNCGAIPDTLIDSELFGHEKGAFTGASAQKRGYFERADTGTIFLDEIGELPLQAQVRLLRVLQDKQIVRVGGSKTLDLDIRIIAATNRDLQQMVTDGDFREDLWFRLNVFPIRLPPLRERRSDLPELLQHFAAKKAEELKLGTVPQIAPEAMGRLTDYDWPGNVRELANVVERALILNPEGPLLFDHVKSTQRSGTGTAAGEGEEVDNLDELVSRQIRRVLKKTNGKIHGEGGAAEMLGLNPSTLRSRMQKLGIKTKEK